MPKNIGKSATALVPIYLIVKLRNRFSLFRNLYQLFNYLYALGASYWLFRKLSSPKKMSTHLNAYNKSDLYERMLEVQSQHAFIDKIKGASIADLKELLTVYIKSKWDFRAYKNTIYNKFLKEHGCTIVCSMVLPSLAHLARVRSLKK